MAHPHFTFRLLGIKPGKLLIHAVEREFTCVTMEDEGTEVYFYNKVIKLAQAAKAVEALRGIAAGGNTDGTYDWTYNDKRLSELYREVSAA